MPLPLYPSVTSESEVRSFGEEGREEEKKNQKEEEKEEEGEGEEGGEGGGEGEKGRGEEGGRENLLQSSEIEGVKVKGSGT